MMRRLFDALLLKGLWKFEPIHVIAFWCFMAYQGWMASPYFMYHVVGAPEPGTAQRYVGTLRVECELQRSKTGWIPPRYFIRTSKGEVEIHCGYRPYLRECSKFYDFHKIHPDMIYSVGYDRYWGMDYIKYPDPIPLRYQANSAPKTIDFGRQLALKDHQTPAAIFFFAFLVYLYLVWQAYENSKPKSTFDSQKPSIAPEAAKEPLELTQLKKSKSFFDQ